jgi:bile acid-coenzyme A ligase
MPIGKAVTWLARRAPGRPAVTGDDRTVTRRELDVRTNRLARAYAERGVRCGDLVTIGLRNGVEFYEAAVAAWKLGAVPQPVSAGLPPRELEAILDLADPALVVGLEAAGRAGVPAGFEADASLSDAPLPPRVAPHWKAPTSGGSTGRPKLILAGQPGLVDPAAGPGFELRPGGVQVVAGPLYHNGPFTYSMRGLLCGQHLVVPPRFDAARTLALIERHRADWILLVPTMMHRILRLPAAERDARDLSSLRTVLHLGAPCPEWLKRAWIEWLGAERIFETYVGTEAQGRTWITGAEWLAHPGSVGRAALGSRFRILDEDGREAPTGEVGEVFLRPGPDMGVTYHYRGAEPRARDGWESLGDMGWADAEGYLYLADRRTDLILRGGANVYPAEVEAALEEHPAVRGSAVIGLPDDDLGNRVHAIVQAEPGLTAAALAAHLAERLARAKIPASFEFTDAPLRDEAGKVRRSALRAERLG